MTTIPWSDDTPADWEPTVEAWQWSAWIEHDVQLGYRKVGKCPRCDDTIAIYQEFGYAGFDASVPAACNCGKSHAGRPEDEDLAKGCGCQGTVQEHP